MLFSLVFLTVKRATGNARSGLVAMMSMFLAPQFLWESQRDLTHSVLVTTLAAATLYVVVLLLRRPRPVLYLALGLVAGLGVLAKYSYVAFIVALGLALLTGRDTRKVLLDPWIIAAALVALAIVTPHAWWLLGHWRRRPRSRARRAKPVPARRMVGISRRLLAPGLRGLWAGDAGGV
jgi:4-amino-4-deoxy-L-arabinose transferase-like glycosyltransferase